MARYRALQEGYLPSPLGMVRVLRDEEFTFDGPKGRWMEALDPPVAAPADPPSVAAEKTDEKTVAYVPASRKPKPTA